MENINKNELNRKIGYWKHVLGKLETRMMKEQSERVDIKSRLIHLHKLR
ncbi:MAG: hypothetical protein R6U32_00725 [Candidatus Woesearchaeota archaeon]